MYGLAWPEPWFQVLKHCYREYVLQGERPAGGGHAVPNLVSAGAASSGRGAVGASHPNTSSSTASSAAAASSQRHRGGGDGPGGSASTACLLNHLGGSATSGGGTASGAAVPRDQYWPAPTVEEEEEEDHRPIANHTGPAERGAAGIGGTNVYGRSTMCGKKKLLMITTSICACASFAFLCIAVATDYWLYMMERTENTNGTSKYDRMYFGLWRKCRMPGLIVKNEGGGQTPVSLHEAFMNNRPTCEYISYFTAMERDGLQTTEAILLTMRRSTLFPLISLFILLVGEIVCFIGHCNHKKKVLTFIAGILYVVGGLITLIGIILFIGAITEEVGSKSKPSGMDEPIFQYSYGSSFMMTVGSFVISELTGVLSVYLYIYRHKHAYRKKQERMTMLESNERPVSSAAANRYRRPPRSHSQSRDHSRDNSPSHSDTYYTYTPVSDTSKEMSNYTLPRDPSRHTLSTTADTHLYREHSVHSVRDHHSRENLTRENAAAAATLPRDNHISVTGGGPMGAAAGAAGAAMHYHHGSRDNLDQQRMQQQQQQLQHNMRRDHSRDNLVRGGADHLPPRGAGLVDHYHRGVGGAGGPGEHHHRDIRDLRGEDIYARRTTPV